MTPPPWLTYFAENDLHTEMMGLRRESVPATGYETIVDPSNVDYQPDWLNAVGTTCRVVYVIVMHSVGCEGAASMADALVEFCNQHGIVTNRVSLAKLRSKGAVAWKVALMG